jgi:hypothetical protein
MDKLKLVIGGIVGIMIGSSIGSTFFKIVSHAGFWTHFLVVSIIGIVLMNVLFRFLKGRYQPDNLPQWLADSMSITIPMGLGILAGAWFSYGSNKADLYIDNGTDKPFVFKIEGEGEFTVKPNDFVKVEVPQMENTMIIGKTERKLKIDNSGNWVFNPEKKYTYVEATEVYGDATAVADTTKSPFGKMINEEFFRSNAEYMFEAPESVMLRKREKSKSIVILYRLGNKTEETKPE